MASAPAPKKRGRPPKPRLEVYKRPDRRGNKPGQPHVMPHIPTEESRRFVVQQCQIGTPRVLIAECMDISNDTLERHYRHELKTTQLEIMGKISGNLAKRAIEGDVVAMIFWLKTRGGWRENKRIKQNVTVIIAKEDADL